MRLILVALLFSLCCLACQKKTHELAKTPKPDGESAQQYNVELDVNKSPSK